MTNALRFFVEARQPQRLIVRARGGDVPWFEGNYAASGELDDAVPDPVRLWTRALTAGLLGSASVPPQVCDAKLLTSERLSSDSQQWTLALEHVDWGALRVLQNLLVARRLDEVELRSELGQSRVDLLPLDAITWPSWQTKLPFRIDRLPITKGTKNRAVKVEFARRPSDSETDDAIASLDLWAELVTWGGYASPSSDPKRSGALPEGAYLQDEVTVAQVFSEAFFADAAAFDAIISYASALVSRGIQIVSVIVQ